MYARSTRNASSPTSSTCCPDSAVSTAGRATAQGTLIGICQRFGPFNLVVNAHRIDRASAEDQGFELANERVPRPYGILLYEDFNLFHVCIGAGLDPFSSLER